MQGEIIIDLETKKSFEEVGGRHNLHLLEVSVVGIYRYQDDGWYTFEERELNQLESLLTEADRIIGFNIKQFDFPVLKPYIKGLLPNRWQKKEKYGIIEVDNNH